MKRSIKNIVLFLLLASYTIFYKVYLFPNHMKYSEIISAAFLVLLFGLAVYLLGFRKDKVSYDSKNILRVTLFYIALAFIIMYGLGVIVGFLKNAYSRDLLTLLDNIMAPIIMIVMIELLRYVVIWANRDKKVSIISFTILFIVFELFMSIRSLNIGDNYLLFTQFATIILPCIVKNIVLSYLCYHIGYKVPIIYRLIMDIYLFIVPIVPDIGDYLNSVILVALPIVIYMNSFSIIDERSKRTEYIFEETRFSIYDIPVTVALVGLAALISGFFPHYMIGVGSDSMSPKINKGDAVIIHKINKNTTLKVKDIIAYHKDDQIIIHRIDSILEENGKKVYKTKGDANNGVDGYDVYPKQIQGVVQVKIPYIAYPTVWVMEYFGKGR